MRRRSFIRALALLVPALALSVTAQPISIKEEYDDVVFKVEGEIGVINFYNNGVCKRTFLVKDIYTPGWNVIAERTLFGERKIKSFHMDFNVARVSANLVGNLASIDHIKLDPPTINLEVSYA